MDLVPSLAFPFLLSGPTRARIGEFKAMALRIYREYPYHCLAYGLFLLRYLLPSSLEMTYALGQALINYQSVRVALSLLFITALVTTWQKRRPLIDWLVDGPRFEALDDFPSLQLDLPGDSEQGDACLLEKNTSDGKCCLIKRRID